MTIAADTKARFWNPSRRETLGATETALSEFSRRIVDFDSQHLFAGGEIFASISEPGVVSVKDFKTRDPLIDKLDFGEELQSVAVSPDLSMLVAIAPTSAYIRRISFPNSYPLERNLEKFSRFAGLTLDATGTYSSFFDPADLTDEIGEWLTNSNYEIRAPFPFSEPSKSIGLENSVRSIAGRVEAPQLRYFPVSSFTLKYDYEPHPGVRKWRRESESDWTETYENGVIKRLKVINEDAVIDGARGVIVSPPAEPTLYVFIPHQGNDYMWLRFRHASSANSEEPWSWLERMKDVMPISDR
jgi:hypothetical protein